MGQHHLLSPSSANRWSVCVGSLFGPPVDDTSGAAAHEGTTCHAVCEFCLLFGEHPKNLIGHTEFSPAGTSIPVDDEMVAAAELYCETVRGLQTEFGIPAENVLLEQHLVHQSIPDGMFGGTSDCLMFSDDTLVVVDLKYGRKRVDPSSLQLSAYVLLALPLLNRAFNRVVQVVIQPRANPSVSRYEPGYEDLNRAWDAIANAAAYCQEHKAALSGGMVPSGSRVAGSHCQYCRRRDSCVEYQQSNTQQVLASTFEHPTDKGRLLPLPVIDMTVEQLLKIDDAGETVRQFLDDVRKHLTARACRGEDIPDRKLILGWTNRAWYHNGAKAVDTEPLQKELPRKLGLKVDDITEVVLVSPARVEKVMKEKGVLKDKLSVLDRYAVRKPTNPRLVHRSARGEEIRPETAVEFLKAIELELGADDHE